MAKYVCDYTQVSSAGDKVIAAANELYQSVSTYSTNIDQDLSEWSGDAKTTFDSQRSGREKQVVSYAKRMNEFGEFIKSASSKIQELDNSLSEMNI